MLSAWILILIGFGDIQPRNLGVFVTKEACERTASEMVVNRHRLKRSLICVHNGGKEN